MTGYANEMTRDNGSRYNNYSVGNRASDKSNRLYDRKNNNLEIKCIWMYV